MSKPSPFVLIFGVLFGLLLVVIAVGLVMLSTRVGARAGQVTWPSIERRIHHEFPGIEQLTVESLSTWLESDEPPPLLLDVRKEAEYGVSHLRGAVRVEPGAELPGLPAGVGTDTPIVAYCSVGYRSSRLAAQLEEAGYTRVANLKGSIFEWANKGHPVVRDGREVRQVHPYDERWGRLLDAELHFYPAD